jgi:hypothetical protein
MRIRRNVGLVVAMMLALVAPPAHAGGNTREPSLADLREAALDSFDRAVEASYTAADSTRAAAASRTGRLLGGSEHETARERNETARWDNSTASVAYATAASRLRAYAAAAGAARHVAQRDRAIRAAEYADDLSCNYATIALAFRDEQRRPFEYQASTVELDTNNDRGVEIAEGAINEMARVLRHSPPVRTTTRVVRLTPQRAQLPARRWRFPRLAGPAARSAVTAASRRNATR